MRVLRAPSCMPCTADIAMRARLTCPRRSSIGATCRSPRQPQASTPRILDRIRARRDRLGVSILWHRAAVVRGWSRRGRCPGGFVGYGGPNRYHTRLFLNGTKAVSDNEIRARVRRTTRSAERPLARACRNTINCTCNQLPSRSTVVGKNARLPPSPMVSATHISSVGAAATMREACELTSRARRHGATATASGGTSRSLHRCAGPPQASRCRPDHASSHLVAARSDERFIGPDCVAGTCLIRPAVRPPDRHRCGRARSASPVATWARS